MAFSDVLNGLIKFITGVFSNDWSMAWDGIKQLFQGLWDGISGNGYPIRLDTDR